MTQALLINYELIVNKDTFNNRYTPVKTHGNCRLCLFLFERHAVVADSMAGTHSNVLTAVAIRVKMGFCSQAVDS